MPWIEPQEEEETGHAVPVQRCFRNRCTHLGIGLLRCGKCKVAVYCGAVGFDLDSAAVTESPDPSGNPVLPASGLETAQAILLQRW